MPIKESGGGGGVMQKNVTSAALEITVSKLCIYVPTIYQLKKCQKNM